MNAPQPPYCDDDILSLLPPVLRGVVGALGLRRAREWLSDYGGGNVTIPLYDGLGLSPAELKRLRETLKNHMDATGRVTLPKCDKLLKYARDEEIRKSRYKTSLKALAKRYHLTTRQIMNICKDLDADEKAPRGQLSLF